MNQDHAQPATVSVAESVEPSPKLSASPVRLTFKLNDSARGHLNRIATSEPAATAPEKSGTLLRIRGIDAEKSRGASIAVYLNLAPGEKPPGEKDPRYAGSVSLFRHAHGHTGINATLSITRVIRKLKKAGFWKNDADFSVTLIQRDPVDKKEKARVIPFEKVSLENPQKTSPRTDVRPIHSRRSTWSASRFNPLGRAGTPHTRRLGIIGQHRVGRSFRNKSSKDMAFPHPKSRKDHAGTKTNRTAGA